MKRQTILGILLSFVFLMTLSNGTGQSQSGEGDPTGPDEVTAQIAPVMSYQGRLTESGVPATGTRNMTFRLFDADSAGLMIWQEGPKSVAVNNGLFNVTLGDVVSLPVNSMDQNLWLEIQVASTVLPRQRLAGAPYALSLAPGAHISGNVPSAALHVVNSGAFPGIMAESYTGSAVSGLSNSSHGVYAKSSGSGGAGSALWAENTAGIAIWGRNGSPDSALVLENQGSGALIKGFGGDGGEDELRILNDGTIATRADTYLFIPGTEALVAASTTGSTLDYEGYGSVRVLPASSGYVDIVFGATLPGILYGQPVKVEEVTVFYQDSAASSYIDYTWVYRQRISGGSLMTYVMGQDDTNQISTAYTSYNVSVTSDNVLSQAEGFVSVQLRLQFASSSDNIRIGGVRLRLGHHPLY